MNCKGFCDRIFLFQAEELPEAERAECQSHLDACAGCAERLRLEDALLGALKRRLSRAAAPPGLESRIRGGLREVESGRAPWYRAGWLAASAAAGLLALLLLLPPEPRSSGGSAGTPSFTRDVVTVIDLDCDRAGKDIEQQRRCLDPHHVNALKVADGSYWTIDATRPEFRYLLLDRGERGARLRVAGRLDPGTGVIRLVSVERFDARGRPSSGSAAAAAALASAAR